MDGGVRDAGRPEDGGGPPRPVLLWLAIILTGLPLHQGVRSTVRGATVQGVRRKV